MTTTDITALADGEISPPERAPMSRNSETDRLAASVFTRMLQIRIVVSKLRGCASSDAMRRPTRPSLCSRRTRRFERLKSAVSEPDMNPEHARSTTRPTM